MVRVLLNIYNIGKKRVSKKGVEFYPKDRIGFTLLELLVALFLLAILSTVGYLSLAKRMQRERLVSEVKAFSSDIQKMKNKALTENRRSGIWIASNKDYNLIFYDDNGNINTIMTKSLDIGIFGSVTGITTCPDGSGVDTGDGINFPGNEIIFLPIGTPTSSGCVVIHSASDVGAVVITPSGDIRTFIYDKKSNNWIEK